jgi:hypothetical protein
MGGMLHDQQLVTLLDPHRRPSLGWNYNLAPFANRNRPVEAIVKSTPFHIFLRNHVFHTKPTRLIFRISEALGFGSAMETVNCEVRFGAMPFPSFACFILASSWFPGGGIRPMPNSDSVGFGPIGTRNGRVVALPFLRFVPRTDFLQRGKTSLEISAQGINDVRRDPKDVKQPSTLEEDHETERVSFLYSRGIGEGLEASIELPILSRGGGIMDPIIHWWHHTILSPQERVRDNLPFGRSFVRIPGVGDFGSATGVGDLSLFARKRLSSRVIVTAGLKIPTGDASKLLGSGSFDVGASVEYRTRFLTKFQFDASLGFVIQGKPTTLRSARGIVDQEFLGVTYLRNSRDAFVVQWQSESAPVKTVSSANGAHRMLTFGYQRRLSDHQRLDLYFSEDHDLVPGASLLVNTAPDFTAGARFVVRF